MRIVVGGEARKAGKTAAVCSLIAALPRFDWTAVKVSGHRHGLAGADFELREETPETAAGDTLRYLKAGARHAWWLRGDLAKGAAALREILARRDAWIVESTRAIGWLEHDVTLIAVAQAGEAVKPSAVPARSMASALVTLEGRHAASTAGAGRLYKIGDAALVSFVLSHRKLHLHPERAGGAAHPGLEAQDRGAPPESA
jgi:hypothetical protein